MNEAEQERFRQLTLPALGSLYRLARALTPDRAAADDLVQETFLRALRYFGSHRGDDIRAWLAAIMRNINRKRRDVVSGLAVDSARTEIADHAPNPEQTMIAKEESQNLRRMVDALPEDQRETLILREFGQLSYAQIAELQQVPVGTVMSRLARARTALRELLLP